MASQKCYFEERDSFEDGLSVRSLRREPSEGRAAEPFCVELVELAVARVAPVLPAA